MICKHWNGPISGICQLISMNEASKCAEINCSSFDYLRFSLEDVNCWAVYFYLIIFYGSGMSGIYFYHFCQLWVVNRDSRNVYFVNEEKSDVINMTDCNLKQKSVFKREMELQCCIFWVGYETSNPGSSWLKCPHNNFFFKCICVFYLYILCIGRLF